MKKFVVLVLSALSLSACNAAPPMTQVAPQLRMQRMSPRPVFARNNVQTQGSRMFSLDELRASIASGIFKRLDRDQNQSVSPEELQNLHRPLNLVELDQNRNGQLELNELVQNKEQVLIERFTVERMQGAFKQAFAKKDLDQNGHVSFQEDREMNMIFDYDGDQGYSYTEYEDGLAWFFSMVPERVQSWIDAHFTN